MLDYIMLYQTILDYIELSYYVQLWDYISNYQIL